MASPKSLTPIVDAESAAQPAATDELDIQPRPPVLHEAVRLANAALELLIAAIDETEADSDLESQLNTAADELESSIGYMTASPEVGFLGQHVHGLRS